MANPTSVFQRAFVGGELAPALHARADLGKYITGLRRCRNFVVQRHGGVTNRPGLRYIGATKTTSINVMLLRYVSEVPGQSLLLELGNGYIRFYLNGAALQVDPLTIDPWSNAIAYLVGDLAINGGTVFYSLKAQTGAATTDVTAWYPFVGNTYELPSPFGADLPHWVQSGRTITLTHKLHPPLDLVFVSLTRWILQPVSTANPVPIPVGLVLTPGAAGTQSYGYVVTAAAADTYEESEASAQVINAACATPTAVAPNVITWTAVPGAPEYYVYCDPFANGTYGFIGTATGAAVFHDTGLTPDFLTTPPTSPVLFAAAGDYPDVAAYFEQRRLFGFTVNVPDAIFGSRTGLPNNFGISAPIQADDAITFRIAGNNHNPVRHLLSLKSLIVLTDAGEWTVNGGQVGVPLAPNAIDPQQQTYVGVGAARPAIIGNAILYVQARGTYLHDLQFDQQVEGLGGRDLSIYATHLFDGFTVTDLAYAQTPNSIVWAVRSDGTLLGLTYIREQDIWGWHRHDTGANGRVEHVVVVPELTEDVVYVIVRRTIGGVFVRYIERLASRQITTFNTDAFFVDAGLTYSGAPATHISGLDHLEGQLVAVLGDGAVVFDGYPVTTDGITFTSPPQFVVTGGAITLPTACSVVHAGLPIPAELETLDLDIQAQSLLPAAAMRDKKKLVGSVTLLLERSSRSFWSGPDVAHLVRYALKPAELAVAEYTGPAELALLAGFNDNGRTFIRQTDPLPITVLGLLPDLALGG